MQIVKCGDYFQADGGPRRFGNICIVTKWIKTTQTSLILRCLEVNYIEVSKLFSVRVIHKEKSMKNLIMLDMNMEPAGDYFPDSFDGE
uniref:Protein tyrosine phosphatase n=1 Tax=Solanum tuberosum TaxID=4113 RepID=M1CA21_SOLTU